MHHILQYYMHCMSQYELQRALYGKVGGAIYCTDNMHLLVKYEVHFVSLHGNALIGTVCNALLGMVVHSMCELYLVTDYKSHRMEGYVAHYLTQAVHCEVQYM